MKYGSILNNDLKYHYILTPTVASISAHSGGNEGNRLTIKGTGFSINPSNITVTVAGIPCDVISSSLREIVCDVGKDYPGNNYGKLSTNSSSQVGGYLSGSGFKYRVFNMSSPNNSSFKK